MQEINKKLIEIFSQSFNFEDKKILEIGSFIVSGQEKLMCLRDYFKNSSYLGCDIRKGNGVDSVEDVENLSFKDDTFDLIICLDTFEHVKNPHIAINEIYRVLKKEGILILSSVMNFAIHEYPYDYHRFTPEYFRLLTSKFKKQFIGYYGQKDFPKNIYALCAKGRLEIISDSSFNKFYNKFKKESEIIRLKDRLRNIYSNLKRLHFLNKKRIEFKKYTN